MKLRLVDRITAWVPYAQIAGRKAVSFEEYRLREPLGDEPALPETLLIECFLQLGNWLILLSSDFRTAGHVVRIREVHFHDRLRPGMLLELSVQMDRRRPDGFEFSGCGTVGNRTLVTGAGCLAVPVAAADYYDPADLRVLAREIGGREPAAPGPVSLDPE